MNIFKKIGYFSMKKVAFVLSGVLENIMNRIYSLELDNEDGHNNETLKELYGLYFHVEKTYNSYNK